MARGLLFIAAFLLCTAPWVAGESLSVTTKVALSICGLNLLVLTSVVTLIAKLYRAATADQAFVRTGMGGVRVVGHGGTLVLPSMHQVVPVSLVLTRLDLPFALTQALQTMDGQQVNAAVSLYLRVLPDPESILKAAQSIGTRDLQSAVDVLFGDRFAVALRRLAQSKTSYELLADADDLAQHLRASIGQDLAQSGLHLEAVTIAEQPSSAVVRGDIAETLAAD